MRLGWVAWIAVVAACGSDSAAVHDPSLKALEAGMDPQRAATFLRTQLRTPSNTSGQVLVWHKGTIATAEPRAVEVGEIGMHTTRPVDYAGGFFRRNKRFTMKFEFANVVKVTVDEPSGGLGGDRTRVPDQVKVVTLHVEADAQGSATTFGWAVTPGLLRQTLAAVRALCPRLREGR